MASLSLPRVLQLKKNSLDAEREHFEKFQVCFHSLPRPIVPDPLAQVTENPGSLRDKGFGLVHMIKGDGLLVILDKFCYPYQDEIS
ncbi:putative actin-binding protein [Operophtera brumata]|uniref:Putative actin-binding protein n=1 Tax=Operophtera brumata TaxID=104452 RepID=A0A0L7KX46_OPEBR|nr:putative actin-binding protein [Operophtera brumata]